MSFVLTKEQDDDEGGMLLIKVLEDEAVVTARSLPLRLANTVSGGKSSLSTREKRLILTIYAKVDLTAEEQSFPRHESYKTETPTIKAIAGSATAGKTFFARHVAVDVFLDLVASYITAFKKSKKGSGLV